MSAILDKYTTRISDSSTVEIEGECGIYLTLNGNNYTGEVVPLSVAQELEKKLGAAIDFISRVPCAKWQYIESGDMAVDAM